MCESVDCGFRPASRIADWATGSRDQPPELDSHRPVYGGPVHLRNAARPSQWIPERMGVCRYPSAMMRDGSPPRCPNGAAYFSECRLWTQGVLKAFIVTNPQTN